MKLPWIRIPVDFFERPFIQDLEDQSEINSRRWLHLVNEACKAGAEGRLVYLQAGEWRGLSDQQLARRCGHDKERLTEYKAFLELCREQGELTTDEQGFPFLPDWRSYWGPLSDAERQQAKRFRDNCGSFSALAPATDEATSEDVLSATAPASEALNHAVSNGLSRSGHAPVTARDTAVTYRTEQEQNRTGTVSLQRENKQTDTEQDSTATSGLPASALPASVGDKSPFPNPDSSRYLAEIASAFERFMPKPDGTPRAKGDAPRKFRRGDRKKLDEYLQREPLASYANDWPTLVTAIRWGLQHMAEDVQAIADGYRKKPIRKHLPYSLQLAGNYVHKAFEAVEKARAAAQNGSTYKPRYEREEGFSED